MTTLVALLALPLPLRAQEADARSYASEHFTIEWVEGAPDAPDLADPDGDGVPDAVVRVVEAFESARAFVIDGLGYAEPPGEPLYPLYVSEGDGRAYTRELPGGDGRSKPSFIVLPPSLANSNVSSDLMKTFAVHEYHHAVQLGYDSDEDHWVTEATSTWLEDVFVDEADSNHRALPVFLPYPNRSLVDEQGSHEYGAFLFLQFLVERFNAGDPTLVRELWEEMAVPQAVPGAPDRDSVGAVEELLRRRGATLQDAWGEFLVWQRRLQNFEEGASYRRVMAGAEWPALSYRKRVPKETCHIQPASGKLPQLSGDYAVFKPGRYVTDATATLTVLGPAGSTGYYLVKPVVGPAVRRTLSFGDDGTARMPMEFDTGSVRRVSIGIGHVATRTQAMTYSLRVDGRSAVAASMSTPSSTSYFNPITLSGSVTCRGAPADLARVTVTATEAGTSQQTVHELRTDDEGGYRLHLSPEVNTIYSVAVDDPLLSKYRIPDRMVAVKLLVRLQVPDDAVTGRVVRVTGSAEPAHPGAQVDIEFRRPSRAWREGPSTIMLPDGRYEADVELLNDGVWELRSRVIPNDGDHAEGVSPGAFIRLL